MLFYIAKKQLRHDHVHLHREKTVGLSILIRKAKKTVGTGMPVWQAKKTVGGGHTHLHCEKNSWCWACPFGHRKNSWWWRFCFAKRENKVGLAIPWTLEKHLEQTCQYPWRESRWVWIMPICIARATGWRWACPFA